MAEKWIPLEDAAVIGGFLSEARASDPEAMRLAKRSLDNFIRRFNARSIGFVVLKRVGIVDETTLRRALRQDAEERTPGFKAAIEADRILKSIHGIRTRKGKA